MKLAAGYSKVCITPDYTVHISGYGDDEIRLSEGVRDDMYITCIALSEGGKTVLLYTTDLLSVSDWGAETIRNAVTPATGIPGEQIFCGATHNHSGPQLYGDREPTVRFREAFLAAAVQAAKEAIADQVPAEMCSGIREIPGMNFIRHYVMEDGTIAGSNFGNLKQPCISHVRTPDPRMVLIRFVRKDKTDIVMMNWQGHNDNVRGVGYYLLSSSYVGRLRAHFEENTGLHFAFFMGASGDQSCNSKIPQLHHGLDWIAYGQKMAEFAIETLPSLVSVTGSGIRTTRAIYDVEINHSWDHMVAQADEVFDLWKTVGKKEGDALGKTYGFTSSYQARDIRTRAKMDKYTQLELNAFSIGDMGFITSPNEVFSTVGKYVRAHSPFETTFIITGNSRYLPCREAYDYRSYEADTSLYAPGAAEKVGEKFVEMLREIKENG